MKGILLRNKQLYCVLQSKCIIMMNWGNVLGNVGAQSEVLQKHELSHISVLWYCVFPRLAGLDL